MTDLTVRELLTRGAATEGQLLIPRTIYAKLIDAVEKRRLGRDLAAIYIGPSGIKGSSVDVDLETKDSMTVYRVSDGAPVPLGNPAYTSFNMKPVKYGVRPAIHKEMQEDGKWALIDHAVRRAGKEMGENEDYLIVNDALENKANNVDGGTAITIANITRAIQYLEDNDYDGTDIIVGPEVMNDIRNIDTYAEFNKYGTREMQTKGVVPVVYGLSVHRVGTHAITSTNAYVIDRDHAFVIAEKRPITIEKYDDKTHDMSGVVVTQRIVVRQLRAAAIAKITTS
jgi:HK97 family phage major capsid protein